MHGNAKAEANVHKKQMFELGFEITKFGFMHRETGEEIFQPTEADGWYWKVGTELLDSMFTKKYLTLTEYLKAQGVEIET
jgi:hypothetical protein